MAKFKHVHTDQNGVQEYEASGLIKKIEEHIIGVIKNFKGKVTNITNVEKETFSCTVTLPEGKNILALWAHINDLPDEKGYC